MHDGLKMMDDEKERNEMITFSDYSDEPNYSEQWRGEFAGILPCANCMGRMVNAAAIGRTNSQNVATMNQVGTLQPQLDMKVNFENDRINIKEYDDISKTLQDHDNFLNDKIAKSAEFRN